MEKILNLKLVIVQEFQNKKNIYAKWYTLNWSEENVVISNIKNTVPWTYVISGKPIDGTFHEKKKLQKINKKELRIEKVIKRKGNKLYIKRKGYDCSFNNWIDKKDIA